MGFAWVSWKSRHGLGETNDAATDEIKHEALPKGVRGETYSYWYLLRLGYVFVARNFMPSRAKSEPDRVGYNGETLAIVEVRTRQAAAEQPPSPEMSIGLEKHELLVRRAEYFLWGTAR